MLSPAAGGRGRLDEPQLPADRDWFVNAAAWQPGARVLDVACGSGFPALAAAAAVRPGGTVVATDISPEMLAVAASRAKRDALDNVEFVEMDAEHLRFSDGEFDAVTNAYGLMFSPDPPRAIAEARRVLRCRGRSQPSRGTNRCRTRSSRWINPWRLRSCRFSRQPPARQDRSGSRQRHSSSRCCVKRDSPTSASTACPMTLELASANEYLQVFSDVAWKARVAALSDRDLARFREAIAEAVQPHIVGGRVRLVASSLCAAGSRTP